MANQPDTTAPFNGQIGFAPMPAVARVLAQFDRAKLGGFVEVAIGLLDMADGDPDLETTAAEDELGECHACSEPGCEIADPDSAAWVEWHTMRGPAERGVNFTLGREDAEVDDHGGCEHDGREPEDEGLNGDEADHSDGDCGAVVPYGLARASR